MQVRRRRSVTVALLVAPALLVLFVLSAAGCGTRISETSSPAADEFTHVLGHAPTGVAAEVAERGVMVVVNDSAYPPFSSVSGSGEMVGFDVDVARAVANVLGVKLQQEQSAWDTIPAALDTGRFDVSIGSMTATAKRREALGFTSPYYWSVEHLAVRSGMPAIDGPAQMRGKTIGCSTQSTAFDYLQKVKGVTIKPYLNETDGLADLKKGRLDAYMSQLSVLMSSISSGQPFELSGDPLYYTAASLAYKKGEQDWGALLEYAVRTLRDDGTLADASKRWFWGFDLTQAPPKNVLVEGGVE